MECTCFSNHSKFLAVCVSLCVEADGFLPKHLCGRCCHKRTDVLALVMRFFFVQLLLKRGATTPSSQNP